jgi:hypothetical protein
MKQITVAYWMGTTIKDIGIEHNVTIPYSEGAKNEIIDLVLSNKLQIMMYEKDETLMIWIDNGKFRQR